MNQSEMAKRQFRDVARVAGLIFQGYPGAQKSIKQVQASGGLFLMFFQSTILKIYYLFRQEKKFLSGQLEAKRLIEKLTEIKTQKIVLKSTRKPHSFFFSPFGQNPYAHS